MRCKEPLILLCTVICSCAPKPEKILYGEDQCAYCRMSIVDSRFGGELVTSKGRVYKFDAVECMIPFQKEHDAEYRYELVTPYNGPGRLISIDSVVFLVSDTIKSPMGANLAAYNNKHFPIERKGVPGEAEVFSWNELTEKIGHR